MHEDPGERQLADRVALLGLAALATDGKTPAHTGQVRRACTDHVEGVDAVIGSVSEAEVNRALNRLEADGHVTVENQGERSAVGKGRPQFALVADPATVVEALRDDDQVGGVAAGLSVQG